MTQSTRNYLYRLAGILDSLPRVRQGREGYKPVGADKLLKLQVQEKVSNIFIIISEAELADIAENLRKCVDEDESALMRGLRK